MHMAGSITRSTRSSNGCWTCRVRKKKCDETRPSCASCTSFGLQCHGYGTKPHWMDNGILQQEQATKIKQLVRQTSRSKKRRWLQASKHLACERGVTRTTSISVAQDLTECQSRSPCSSSDPPPSDIDRKSISESTWQDICNESLNLHLLPDLQSYGDLNIAEPDMDWIQASDALFGSTSGSPHSHELEIGCHGTNARAELADPLADLHSVKNSTLSEGNHLNQCVEFNTLDHLASSGEDQSTRSLSHRAHRTPSSTSGWGHTKDFEDMLFMHYLDQVFYVQFPFFDTPERRKRGWLLSLLKGARAAHYACLALSELHLRYMQSSNANLHLSLETPDPRDSYYEESSRHLEVDISPASWWDESSRLMRSLESLICIVQLLFWQIFAGTQDNWQKYLRSAASLLSNCDNISSYSLPHSGAQRAKWLIEAKDALDFRDTQAADLTLGSLVAFDILSCASIRSRPFLDLDHKAVLRELGPEANSYLGFDYEIMIIILEISQLDNWKREADKSQKLSIVELAKRGSRIEDRLRQQIAEIESTSVPGLPPKHDSRVLVMSAFTSISRIFALAAIVYLHVVISGAHPELSEVKDGVSRTLAALQSLTDRGLLANTAWAFCIAGSLAVQQGQQDSFRELFDAAGKSGNFMNGTFMKAFKVMEVCWEIREAGGSCDWVFGMDKLGWRILLR